MVRGRRETAGEALGLRITTPPSIVTLVLWRREVASPRAVHVVFGCVAAHGLHVFCLGWWCWRHCRSVRVSLLSGNAVLARWIARSAPTMRSRGLSAVVCCRGGRVAGVYVVVMRPVLLVRLRITLVGILRLVFPVRDRLP